MHFDNHLDPVSRTTSKWQKSPKKLRKKTRPIMQYNATATESPGQLLQKGQWNKRDSAHFRPQKPFGIFEMNELIELMNKGLFAWYRNDFHSETSSFHLLIFLYSVYVIPKRHFVPVQVIRKLNHSGFLSELNSRSGTKFFLVSCKLKSKIVFKPYSLGWSGACLFHLARKPRERSVSEN